MRILARDLTDWLKRFFTVWPIERRLRWRLIIAFVVIVVGLGLILYSQWSLSRDIVKVRRTPSPMAEEAFERTKILERNLSEAMGTIQENQQLSRELFTALRQANPTLAVPQVVEQPVLPTPTPEPTPAKTRLAVEVQPPLKPKPTASPTATPKGSKKSSSRRKKKVKPSPKTLERWLIEHNWLRTRP